MTMQSETPPSDEELIDRVYGKYTKASRERLQAMIHACRLVDERGIEGDVVECGVWRGGHIILARLVSPQRRCWLYDTFDGMPKPDPILDIKVHDKGRPAMETWVSKTADGGKWAAASVEEVIKNLSDEGVWSNHPDKCRMIVGKVEETLLSRMLPEKIALLRLDTDWYASTKIELKTLYPRLQTGGVLIVDDFGHWRGCRDACLWYFKKMGVEFETKLTWIDYTAVMFVKGS